MARWWMSREYWERCIERSIYYWRSIDYLLDFCWQLYYQSLALETAFDSDGASTPIWSLPNCSQSAPSFRHGKCNANTVQVAVHYSRCLAFLIHVALTVQAVWKVSWPIVDGCWQDFQWVQTTLPDFRTRSITIHRWIQKLDRSDNRINLLDY